MTCQYQVKRCRSRGSVSSHAVGICKRLQVLVLFGLVVRHVMKESLHNLLIESLGLPVCLRKVRCSEVVFGTQYSAYRVEEPGSGLPAVFGYDVLEVPYA